MKFPRLFLALALSMTTVTILIAIVDSASSVAFAEEGGLPDDVMDTTVPAVTQPKKSATPPPKNKSAEKTAEKIARAKPVEAKKEAKKAETKKTEPNKAETPKAATSKVDAKAPAAAAGPELQALKSLDRRYQSAKSVAMDLDKTVVVGLLGKEKKSKGHLLLSKGKMRMEIKEPAKSIVVVDGKTLWVVDYPPEEFKNAAVQVAKGAFDSKKAANQSFVSLLTRGGILKHFKVSAVQKDDQGRALYFMQPTKQSFEFKRAQLTLSADGKEISELRYWDERDNETRLMFSNVKFDKPVPEKSFEFTPPENADVSTF